MKEGYGPIVHVLPAASPDMLVKAMARTMHLVTTHSRCDVVRSSRTEVVVRYSCELDDYEQREMCLSRQAAIRGIPAACGLPAALVTETTCIAQGDEYCEYTARFYTRSRWLPTVVGMIVGAASAFGLSRIGLLEMSGWFLLPTICALLGALWELRHTYRANVDYGEHVQSALREIAENEGEARREIIAFHQRQKEWGTLMEEQVGERTRQLQDLIARIESIGEARVTSVRGFTHDLRNPLAILRGNFDYLQMVLRDRPELGETLSDNDIVVEQMEKMLQELTSMAKAEAALIRVNPTQMDIEPWVGTLRRRVKALAFGKDVSVSVFRRREAPDAIQTDALIFDRIVDNLCSNAAKYTDTGSIIVEIDGKPGFLTLKVSDTGRGIAPERIKEIFEPGGGSKEERAPFSLGVGLSVVVHLMAQIGGKLEVMSKLDEGTTFWAHLPTQLPTSVLPEDEPAESHVKLADVVTIRKIHTG